MLSSLFPSLLHRFQKHLDLVVKTKGGEGRGVEGGSCLGRKTKTEFARTRFQLFLPFFFLSSASPLSLSHPQVARPNGKKSGAGLPGFYITEVSSGLHFLQSSSPISTTETGPDGGLITSDLIDASSGSPASEPHSEDGERGGRALTSGK